MADWLDYDGMSPECKAAFEKARVLLGDTSISKREAKRLVDNMSREELAPYMELV